MAFNFLLAYHVVYILHDTIYFRIQVINNIEYQHSYYVVYILHNTYLAERIIAKISVFR